MDNERRYEKTIYALLVVIVILIGALILGGYNYTKLENRLEAICLNGQR